MLRLRNIFALTLTTTMLVACGGEDPTLDENGRETKSCRGTQGTPGSAGGAGGSVTVRFAALEQTPMKDLVAAIHVDGGKGGAGGAHGEPIPAGHEIAAASGDSGKPGRTEVSHHSGLSLASALQGIDADDALYVTSGEIYLKTQMLEGPLRVRRLVVAPGVDLKLSGGWVIEAEEVVVSPGASIIISDLGERTKNVFGNTVGENGGDLVLRARRLELHGDIIASGVPGAAGKNGGKGGRLLIEAESLHLGAEGGIHAAGGDGGAGAPGTSCR
jgi:hypothetical protein